MPALALGSLTGVASEGSSQIIKKIANRKGRGLYLGLKKGNGIELYDLSDTKEGSGLLGSILGLLGKKIPILNKIPLLGALF